jgi:hypothetical protein
VEDEGKMENDGKMADEAERCKLSKGFAICHNRMGGGGERRAEPADLA